MTVSSCVLCIEPEKCPLLLAVVLIDIPVVLGDGGAR